MKILNIIFVIILLTLFVVNGLWAVNSSTAPVWTGFHFPIDSELGFSYRTLWDWLEILVIPLVLAISVWLLANIEKHSNLSRERSQQIQSLINNFFDKVIKVTFNEYQTIPIPVDDRNTIIRGLLLSTLRQVGKTRKPEVIQFIYEFNLLHKEKNVNVNGANLRCVDFDSSELVEVAMKGVYFDYSTFKNANLSESLFIGSSFTNCIFENTTLKGTDFSNCHLENSFFRNCDLRETTIEFATLDGSRFSKSQIREDQKKQILRKKGHIKE